MPDASERKTLSFLLLVFAIPSLSRKQLSFHFFNSSLSVLIHVDHFSGYSACLFYSFIQREFFSLMDSFQTSELCQKFKTRPPLLNIVEAEMWITISSVEPTVMICSTDATKSNKREAGSVFTLMSGIAELRVLRELKTAEVRHMLKTAFSSSIMCDSNAHARGVFRIVLVSKKISAAYNIAWSLIQLLLRVARSWKEGSVTELLDKASTVETLLYLHSTTFVETQKNTMSTKKTNSTAVSILFKYQFWMHTSPVVQQVTKPWKLVLRTGYLEKLKRFVSVFLFDKEEEQLKVLQKPLGGCSPLSQLDMFYKYLNYSTIEKDLYPTNWGHDTTILQCSECLPLL